MKVHVGMKTRRFMFLLISLIFRVFYTCHVATYSPIFIPTLAGNEEEPEEMIRKVLNPKGFIYYDWTRLTHTL